MNSLIKDVLLNISLITIIILLWNFFYQKNLDSHLYQKATLFIAAIFSIALCTLFPLGFGYNFLYIPIGIAGLYGGAIVSSILFVGTVPLLFLFDGEKIEIILMILVLQTLTNIILSSYFNKSKINIKIIMGILLITIFSSISLITLISVNPSDYEILSIGLGIVFLQIVFVAFCIFLIETFKTTQVKKEILIRSEKMKGLYHLTAAFGHEIRQPITICKGMLQLIAEDSFAENKKNELLSTTITELNRAEKIIRDYQVFAEPLPKQLEKFDLVMKIQQVIDSVKPLFDERNIQINLNLSSAWINGDLANIERCLIHICTNSFESMDSGGVLTIDSYSVDGKSILEISDTGIGMTKKQLSRLGEPFFSINGKGTGLGMMVVFRLVEGMEGEIEIQSKIGEGTKVKILFITENQIVETQKVQELIF